MLRPGLRAAGSRRWVRLSAQHCQHSRRFVATPVAAVAAHSSTARHPVARTFIASSSHSKRFGSTAAQPTPNRQKTGDPLRILFCGSDDLSCAVLEALEQERQANPSLIESISVAVRPGKRHGRGRKLIRHPPLRDVALRMGKEEEGRFFELDTFTGWQMPAEINLIVAVSFGLFVPPRLLSQAQYGGLNVHPSNLPEYRGAAPLHHALLDGRSTTGVTLQTLDDRRFDHGVILSRGARSPHDSPAVPRAVIPIPPLCSVAQLTELVKPVCTAILVEGLRRGVHVPPHESVDDDGHQCRPIEEGERREGHESTIVAGQPLQPSSAPKITKGNGQLPLHLHAGAAAGASSQLERQMNIAGPLWFQARPDAADGDSQPLRILIEQIEITSIDSARTQLNQEQKQPQRAPTASNHIVATPGHTHLAQPGELPRRLVDQSPESTRWSLLKIRRVYDDSSSPASSAHEHQSGTPPLYCWVSDSDHDRAVYPVLSAEHEPAPPLRGDGVESVRIPELKVQGRALEPAAVVARRFGDVVGQPGS